MAEFNKVYVNCVGDESLRGKYGYFSDNIDALERYVTSNNLKFWGRLSYIASSGPSFPFVSENATAWRFFYHDPSLPQVPTRARRATNRELALWLAYGNGEACYFNKATASECFTEFRYHPDYADDLVSTCRTSRLMLRKWGTTEWHEPTIDYLGLEE